MLTLEKTIRRYT